jgi:hypothetical protein
VYNHYYDGAWQWADHGSWSLTGGFGLAVYDDPVSGTHQLHLWAVGADGNLYNHYYDGTWHWVNHGNDGVSLWPYSSTGVTVYDDPVSGTHQLQVWARGSDGNLYNRYYDGDWHWADHGSGGAALSTGPAVWVYDDPVSGGHQLQVWAAGVDGNLYNHYYDGSWYWDNHGNPFGPAPHGPTTPPALHHWSIPSGPDHRPQPGSPSVRRALDLVLADYALGARTLALVPELFGPHLAGCDF